MGGVGRAAPIIETVVTTLNPDGSVNEELAGQIAAVRARWCKLPEVTGEYDWSRSEQLLCRSWLRDGECFWQYLEGDVNYLTHGSAVPLSLELMESDMVPMDYTDTARNILQGIERNAWRRPIAYWVYKDHPGEWAGSLRGSVKRVPTDRIGHMKLVDRIG